MRGKLKLSPLNCLQELAPKDSYYPWRVMATCILLNQTHGRQVRPMIDEFWRILPNPTRITHLPPDDHQRLLNMLRPLGFGVRRFHALTRNALDYQNGVPLYECFGIGQYGRDAIDIFVYGKIDVEPSDKWLMPYLLWRKRGGPAVEWDKPEEILENM